MYNNQQPTANSQQPTANSQQPTANSQQPTANSQQPTANSRLHIAKTGKKDEFYTQLDVERELKHYTHHFKNKIVFCNCDDPEESNFWKYFSLNFEHLELKALIATHYETSKPSYKLEIRADINQDGKINRLDTIRTQLTQNGDFRSPECVEILKEADIVVTNPPFSLFREYVAQLVEHDKKFLIIGNQNAITYKEIFSLIKDNKLWLGYGFKGSAAHFINKHYEDYATATDRKEGMIRVSGVHWFTNLEIKKRHEDLILYKKYQGNESYYPMYENYNAIEVSKTKDIPIDYDGVMGVPITFMDKFNPDQFDILGMCENEDLYSIKKKVYSSLECKQAYLDKFGKKGTYDLNASGVLIRNGLLEKVYQRILIKRKK